MNMRQNKSALKSLRGWWSCANSLKISPWFPAWGRFANSNFPPIAPARRRMFPTPLRRSSASDAGSNPLPSSCTRISSVCAGDFHLHLNFAGVGVLERVGQRFLDDEENVVAHVRRQRPWPAGHAADRAGSGWRRRRRVRSQNARYSPPGSAGYRCRAARPRRFPPAPARSGRRIGTVCRRGPPPVRDCPCPPSTRPLNSDSRVSDEPSSSCKSWAMRARSCSSACCCSARCNWS